MTEQTRPQIIPGRFYVLDRFADTPHRIVAGPFETAAAAKAELDQLNIAEDCEVVRAVLRFEQA